MQKSYTNEQLNQIASDNYRVLSEYCNELTQEGYFDKAEEILHLGSEQVLDLYVQSLLVQFMVFGKRLNKEELMFAAGITGADVLGLREACLTQNFSEAISKSEHFLAAPPILLQLLSLRDGEKNLGVTGLFFDAVLNILICMSYLKETKDTMVSRYIGRYFDKVAVFLTNPKELNRTVDAKYIFKKLCSGNLSDSAAMLRTAEDDFALYKRRYYYYRQDTGTLGASGSIALMREEKKEEKTQLLQYLETSQESAEEAFAAVDDYKERKSSEEIDRLLTELNRMIGLREVKEEIHSLINLIKVKKLREKYKLPQMNMSYHMVFTGSPGTGKTTVARLVARIYRELGILSKGTLTETDRSGLVAGYVGQTALKVKETVERALGGVLFIDEAYSLAPENSTNDFGAEAIDTLVKLMEDHRDDLVIIVAGYTDEMQRFLKANTGLYSRFNKFIQFSDYTEEELLRILQSMAEDAGFCFTEGAVDKIKVRLHAMNDASRREFGNARGIRNMFERLVSNQANRIIQYKTQSIKDITVITEEDVAE